MPPVRLPPPAPPVSVPDPSRVPPLLLNAFVVPVASNVNTPPVMLVVPGRIARARRDLHRPARNLERARPSDTRRRRQLTRPASEAHNTSPRRRIGTRTTASPVTTAKRQHTRRSTRRDRAVVLDRRLKLRRSRARTAVQRPAGQHMDQPATKVRRQQITSDRQRPRDLQRPTSRTKPKHHLTRTPHRRTTNPQHPTTIKLNLPGNRARTTDHRHATSEDAARQAATTRTARERARPIARPATAVERIRRARRIERKHAAGHARRPGRIARARRDLHRPARNLERARPSDTRRRRQLTRPASEAHNTSPRRRIGTRTTASPVTTAKRQHTRRSTRRDRAVVLDRRLQLRACPCPNCGSASRRPTHGSTRHQSQTPTDHQ